MALKGTLGDFALTDILQLIGLQRKTGVLYLRREREEVAVVFDAGRVVSAESNARPIEHRVGSLLVRTGKLTEERLDMALDMQKQTLKRLGHVLIERCWIDRDSLCRLLQLQLTETVYDLFRWKNGEYDFQPENSVDWDRELVVPVASETLLMEGAQMVDEWPLIERVIPSRSVVLEPTAAAREVMATRADGEEAAGSIYDEDIDFGFLPENPLEDERERELRIDKRELAVLRWLDGERTCGEIAELTGLGSFEAMKILANLVEAGLASSVGEVEDGRRSVPRLLRSASVGRALFAASLALALLGGLAALVDVTRALVPGFASPLPLPEPLVTAEAIAESVEVDELYDALSAARLIEVEKAAVVFLFESGRWPAGVHELVGRGLLDPRHAEDPWGRPYQLFFEDEALVVSEEEGGSMKRAPLRVKRVLTEIEVGMAPRSASVLGAR